MGFYKNLGSTNGKPNVDPVLSAFEEAGCLVEMIHIASGKTCVFPSWITDFSDTYSSAWNAENIFGRNDKIGVFQGTSRMINMSLNIPSFSVVEARENMHQLEHFIAHLYPSYKGNTMVGSPLIKIKFGNLIKNAAVVQNAVSAAKGGLSGWVDNLSFTPDLEAGMHHMSPNMSAREHRDYNGEFQGEKRGLNTSHTFLPKVLNLNFNFNVVHEHKLGWQGTSWLGGQSGAASFPYGVETLSGKQHFTGENTTGATTRTRGKVAEKFKRQVFDLPGPNV